MKHWWKILSVMILLYVMTIGLMAPLSPGITSVTPITAKTGGQISVDVTGYNSNYTKSKEIIRAWLYLDTLHAVCSDAIKVIDDTHLEIAFTIPNDLPVKGERASANLLINTDKDGTSLNPAAISISRNSVNNSEIKADWISCSIDNLFVNEQYDYPFRNILGETIRNLYFHVPMWFGMIFILLASVIYSVKYLAKSNPINDIKAQSYAAIGLIYGVMGLVTGGIWAEYTWGSFWSNDVKQLTSVASLLIYLAYFVLRSSFEDTDKKARISAVYNVFAFAALVPLLFVIPRLFASLHPGNGGNPGFGGEDLDNTMRTVFYPAVIGWTLLGFWMGQLLYRYGNIRRKMYDDF